MKTLAGVHIEEFWKNQYYSHLLWAGICRQSLWSTCGLDAVAECICTCSCFHVSAFYFLLAQMQQQTSCMVVCVAKFCRIHLLLLVMSCCWHCCWCVFCCVYFGGMLALHFSLSAPLFWITYWVKPENLLHIFMQLVHTCTQTIAYMYVVYLKKRWSQARRRQLVAVDFFLLCCFYFSFSAFTLWQQILLHALASLAALAFQSHSPAKRIVIIIIIIYIIIIIIYNSKLY